MTTQMIKQERISPAKTTKEEYDTSPGKILVEIHQWGVLLIQEYLYQAPGECLHISSKEENIEISYSVDP